MKYAVFIAAVLFSLLTHGSEHVPSKHSSLISANFEWYVENRHKVNALLETGTDYEVIPLVNTICLIWMFRDGAIGSEISPAVAQSLIHRPHLTLLWFHKNQREFDSFVEEIPDTLFTDYDGSYADELSVLKNNLLLAMNSYFSENKENELGSLAKILIRKIENTEITVVD